MNFEERRQQLAQAVTQDRREIERMRQVTEQLIVRINANLGKLELIEELMLPVEPESEQPEE